MSASEQDRPNRERSAEQDRRAWNLPAPPLVPVGPVHEAEPQPEEPVEGEEEANEPDA